MMYWRIMGRPLRRGVASDGGRTQAIDCRPIAAKRAGHVGCGIASVQACKSFPPLMRIERPRPAEPNAFRLCSCPALAVRATIKLRSNSAKPPRTVNMSCPCGVVVSHHASRSERKPGLSDGRPWAENSAESAGFLTL
jgi:hypothetical protein